jgi:hypothetical protein
MEGIRMVDEWPMIERRIPSLDVVFRKLVDSSQIRLGGDKQIDEALGSGGASEISLTDDEARVYRLVDGSHTVQEIVDSTGIGEFEVCRTLFDLLSRDLIAVLGRQKAGGARADVRRAAPSRIPGYVLLGAALFAAAVGVTVHRGAPFAVLGLGTMLRVPLGGVLHGTSRARLENVDRALQAFRALEGRLPEGLGQLADAGLLRADQLADPWNRPYEYSRVGDGYVLSAVNAGGEPLPGGLIERRWAGNSAF